MNHKHRDTYSWLVKLCFLLLLLMLSSRISYTQVKAYEAVLQGNSLVIKVTIPSSPNAPCYSIQRVELIKLTDKTKTVAKSLEGYLKDLPAGNHEFLWDYKKDNGYLEDNYDINVYLEACPSVPNVDPSPKRNETIPITPMSGSSRVALKLLAGSSCIATAIFANSVRSTFNRKNAALTALESTLPQIDGQFTSQADLDKWNAAYADTKAAQKTGVLNALVAGSILSLACEVYLLVSKPKQKYAIRKIDFYPSSSYNYHSGISLIYHF